MPILRRLLEFLRPYRPQITLGFLLLIVDIALELAPGLLWAMLVDRVAIGRDMSALPWGVGGLIGVALAEAFVSRSRRILIETAAQGFVRDLRDALFGKLARLPMGYYGDARTGDLMSRVGADVEAVQEVVVNGTDTLLANLLRLLGVAVIFVWLQPLLGSLSLIPIACVGVMVYRFNRRIRPLYSAARAELGRLTARLADVLSGMRVVKSFAREALERATFEALNEQYTATNRAAVRARANLFPLIGFTASFTNTLIIGFGAYLIARGEFTLGGLVAMRTYGRFFIGPVDSLAQINDMVQRAVAAGGRVIEVLDTPETVQDPVRPKELVAIRGELTFDRVAFAYPVDGIDPSRGVLPKRSLEGVSFTVPAGKRVAIVGPSGAGKSTLFALAQRFYDPQEGEVRLDGIDLRDVAQADLRRQIVAVPQESFLFSETVRENIRYGRPGASDEDVESAARLANAHEFILELPEGYETRVGERGVKLSGGQRQRVAVARAFLANGPVLLLDEATSSVEPESERIILEALERLQQGRTVLMATHRLASVEDADAILVVEGGRVVEYGAHRDLVAAGGAYARLIGRVERQ